MTPQQPLVSIALCTYNGEQYLAKQMQSLLNQTYQNLELVIVDDCSVDNTKALLLDFEKNDSRIRLILNETNLGYIKNFEKAILECKGKYIALCDQDDIWLPEKVQTMVDAINGHILVYHNSDFIDADDRRIGNSSMASKYNMYDGESCLPVILYNCISGHASLFDRDLIKSILPFNSKFHHDWWISYVAFNVGKVKFINKVLVHYRQHQHSVTDYLEMRRDPNRQTRIKNIGRISLDLEWIKYCTEFNLNREPGLIDELYLILSNLAAGKERIKAFNFLMKHFDLLFYIRYKSKGYLSKLNFVRKICFN